jgi:hypothetical protein
MILDQPAHPRQAFFAHRSAMDDLRLKHEAEEGAEIWEDWRRYGERQSEGDGVEAE